MSLGSGVVLFLGLVRMVNRINGSVKGFYLNLGCEKVCGGGGGGFFGG